MLTGARMHANPELNACFQHIWVMRKDIVNLVQFSTKIQKNFFQNINYLEPAGTYGHLMLMVPPIIKLEWKKEKSLPKSHP